MKPSEQKAYIIPYGDDSKVFLDVRILELKVVRSNKLTQSPVQTGVLLNDHKVRNPNKIDVKCAIEINDKAKNTLSIMTKMYENTTFEKLSSIQTRTGELYKHMALLNLPHTEDIESYDTFIFDLQFQEIMVISDINNGVEPIDPSNSSTVDGGKK